LTVTKFSLKIAQNERKLRECKNGKSPYRTGGKWIWLDFVSDTDTAISVFHRLRWIPPINGFIMGGIDIPVEKEVILEVRKKN